MLEHGGRLQRAAQRYGLPLEQWLDLSTGLNPMGWPVNQLPATAWLRLPEDDDDLVQAARSYYGAPLLLPVAGSQAAIQALPQLRARCRAGLLAPSYAEHQHHWRAAGHDVLLLTAEQCADAADTLDVVVVVNPNNPTGQCFDPRDLLDWHARLRARGGWLIVDEAFVDTCPERSLAAVSDREGLIVLRSLGKFFGLAGARVGFVLAAQKLLTLLTEHLGPWSVAGPSRWVATQALRDHDWQVATSRRLRADSARLAAVLNRCGLQPTGGSALFQWVVTSHAAAIHDSLARCGILVRVFNSPPSLRFGLPGSDTAWQRLEQCLASLQWVHALP